jgi:hypothetical protein
VIPRSVVTIGAFALTSAALGSVRADQAVQIPLGGVLDGRPVSTLTNGVEVRWTTGVDAADGFVTSSLAAHLGQAGPGLPDDGVFPENADHPEIVLHFSNDAPATAPQAHLLVGAGAIQFPVPAATYSKIFLSLTSSRGDSTLGVTMAYEDGTTSVSTLTLPDWGTGDPLPTSPPIFFSIVSGLHKWNAQDMSVDTPTHGITGVVLTPSPTKILNEVELAQTSEMPYLTLWGATGLATGVVDGSASDAVGSPSDALTTSAADGPNDEAQGPGGDSGAMPADAAAPPPTADAGEIVDVAADRPATRSAGEAGCGCTFEAGGPCSFGALFALGLALAIRSRRSMVGSHDTHAVEQLHED